MTSAAVATVLVATTGMAEANAPGAGDFIGHEYPPASTLYDPPTPLCAKFNASSTDPLVHVLDIVGIFHGVAGDGTARFESTNPYDANPEGTYRADSNCSVVDDVEGTLTITFTSSDGSISYSCTGPGAFERRGTSVYTLQYEPAPGSCSAPNDTNVVFSGGMEPCLGGCATDPNAAAIMEGTYAQTDA